MSLRDLKQVPLAWVRKKGIPAATLTRDATACTFAYLPAYDGAAVASSLPHVVRIHSSTAPPAGRSLPMIARPFLLCAALGLACGTPVRPQTTAPATPTPVPAEQLDGMDNRKALPLLPHMALHQKEQMRGHLHALHAAIAATAAADWSAVQAAGQALGSSPGMNQTCDHMGSAADGFTEQALDMHRRADAIAPAAADQDADAVLTAIAHTVAACNECHDTWKQQVVSAEQFAAMAKGSH